MIIDCISDLHGETPRLEGGDLLIVAGDMTARDEIPGWKRFFDWFKAQDYRKKIYIGGNHDVLLSQCLSSEQARIMDLFDESTEFAEYLCDSSTDFEGLKIWGAPWTWRFFGINPDCTAFTFQSRNDLKEKWELIPDDTDILVTHGPPNGILDKSEYSERFGCNHLTNAVMKLPNLKLHVFGHIHEGHGQTKEYQGRWDSEPTELMHLSVNCAHMDGYYNPVNKPIRVVL